MSSYGESRHTCQSEHVPSSQEQEKGLHVEHVPPALDQEKGTGVSPDTMAGKKFKGRRRKACAKKLKTKQKKAKLNIERSSNSNKNVNAVNLHHQDLSDLNVHISEVRSDYIAPDSKSASSKQRIDENNLAKSVIIPSRYMLVFEKYKKTGSEKENQRSTANRSRYDRTFSHNVKAKEAINRNRGKFSLNNLNPPVPTEVDPSKYVFVPSRYMQFYDKYCQRNSERPMTTSNTEVISELEHQCLVDLPGDSGHSDLPEQEHQCLVNLSSDLPLPEQQGDSDGHLTSSDTMPDDNNLTSVSEASVENFEKSGNSDNNTLCSEPNLNLCQGDGQHVKIEIIRDEDFSKNSLELTGKSSLSHKEEDPVDPDNETKGALSTRDKMQTFENSCQEKQKNLKNIQSRRGLQKRPVFK
ncbi:hypothetical protein WDU94_002739 [Cyamophila willieti]